MIQAWIPEVRDRSGVDTTYTPIGSGGGIRAITTRIVDFGASDVPLSPAQAKACKGCLLVPWAVSATTLSYNVPGAGSELRLTGPVIADIYLGKITNWSDPRITSLNPGKDLPSQAISPIFRSDQSGDTYAFTSYLTKISPAWKDDVGTGTAVDFPSRTTGAMGNAGVVGTITRTKGAIGYVSVAYAVNNKLGVASIQNAAGQFVRPDLAGIEAAAQVGQPQPDNSVPIVDPPASAKDAYPISTFTYAIVPKDASKAAELKELLEYAIGPGQEFSERYVFAKLPARVVELAKKTIASIGS